MKPVFCALLLATVSLCAIAAPQATREPLSKAEVLELVSRAVPNKVVAEAVRLYGISFEPTEQVLKEFRKAGADDLVLKAMRESWRWEPAKPLSDKEIQMLLEGDAHSEQILKLVQQRGIGFQPTDEYLAKLRSGGAKDELIEALRASAAKPFSRNYLLQWLASGVDADQIGKEVRSRGIDFDPSEEDLGRLRGAGASESLLQAIREAKRFKPPVNQPPSVPELKSPSRTVGNAVKALKGARVVCPPSASSIPVFPSPNDVNTIAAYLGCGDRVVILEKHSGRIGIDRILLADGKMGFVQDSYLSSEYVTAPVPSYKPEPGYTSQARHDKIEGKVVLRIVIDVEGDVADAQEVSQRLGDGLDEMAIETVKTWKFKPAQEGVPVAVRVIVEIDFRLFH